MTVTGGYVRHRDRMVQASVFEDLQNTLIACRWMSGTTSRPVIDPSNSSAGWQLVTTDPANVLPLVGKRDDGSTAEVVLIDYFPEASGVDDGDNDEGQSRSRKTELNTLAIDTGVPGDAGLLEMGSNMVEQPYTFAMAFYATSDAVAMALMNDLRDRYAGRIVTDDHIELFDFNGTVFGPDTPPVVRMEVDSFRYSQNSDHVTPWEVHLYFAELMIADFVDPMSAAESVPIVANVPAVDVSSD